MEDKDIEIVIPKETLEVFQKRFESGGSYECTFCGLKINVLRLVPHMSHCLSLFKIYAGYENVIQPRLLLSEMH